MYYNKSMYGVIFKLMHIYHSIKNKYYSKIIIDYTLSILLTKYIIVLPTSVNNPLFEDQSVKMICQVTVKRSKTLINIFEKYKISKS